MSKNIGFNGLLPKEWVKLTKSVISSEEVSSPREKYQLEHGATFPVALAERFIKMYTKEGDVVLDPFAGVGDTLIAAKNLGRKGIGIELYEKFVKLAKDNLSQKGLFEDHEQIIINGDCRNLLEWVKPESVQLVFTSPPYANYIYRSVEDRKKTHKNTILSVENNSVVKPYGNDYRDFGNLPYPKFLEEIKELMKKLYIVTKRNGYNVWVVKDFRDTKNNKPLVSVHSDFAKIGEEVGFIYHDLIIWDQNKNRKLVLNGYPSVFYVNINHTFLVVLRKA